MSNYWSLNNAPLANFNSPEPAHEEPEKKPELTAELTDKKISALLLRSENLNAKRSQPNAGAFRSPSPVLEAPEKQTGLTSEATNRQISNLLLREDAMKGGKLNARTVTELEPALPLAQVLSQNVLSTLYGNSPFSTLGIADLHVKRHASERGELIRLNYAKDKHINLYLNGLEVEAYSAHPPLTKELVFELTARGVFNSSSVFLGPSNWNGSIPLKKMLSPDMTKVVFGGVTREIGGFKINYDNASRVLHVDRGDRRIDFELSDDLVSVTRVSAAPPPTRAEIQHLRDKGRFFAFSFEISSIVYES